MESKKMNHSKIEDLKQVKNDALSLIDQQESLGIVAKGKIKHRINFAKDVENVQQIIDEELKDKKYKDRYAPCFGYVPYYDYSVNFLKKKKIFFRVKKCFLYKKNYIKIFKSCR